jgi:hypothetical protein
MDSIFGNINLFMVGLIKAENFSEFISSKNYKNPAIAIQKLFFKFHFSSIFKIIILNSYIPISQIFEIRFNK